jgi:hypothetical protein
MLLTDFPHSITLHLATEEVDSYGNSIVSPAMQAVEIPCRLQSMSTSNDATSSRVQRQYKCIAAFDAPLKERSRADVDGSPFIVSNVIRRNDSPNTMHCTATLREEA